MNIIKLADVFYKAAQEGQDAAQYDGIVYKQLHDFLLSHLTEWVKAKNFENNLIPKLMPKFKKEILQYARINIPVQLIMSVDETKVMKDFEAAVNFFLRPPIASEGNAEGVLPNGESRGVYENLLKAISAEINTQSGELFQKLEYDVMALKPLIEQQLNQTGASEMKTVKTIEGIDLVVPQSAQNIPVA